MRYLGIDIKKPKIGIFDFTSCEGCELQLVNKEETLIDFLSLLEIVNFREISSDQSDNYDIALVEGSISRRDEIERLKRIRANAEVLVAFGTCACFGGVNHLKNYFPVKDVINKVYGEICIDTDRVTKIGDIVKVDIEIPGCPVSKTEVEKIIINIVIGTEIKFPKYPVCVECKHNFNTCVFDLGKICLGPITMAGCGAVCPSSKIGCLGCRGPADDANYESLIQIMQKKGFSEFLIKERLDFYNAFSGVLKNED